MATGDALDFRGRLRAALPAAWFPVTGSTDPASATPILDAILAGFAAAWATTYSNLQWVRAQARIATATGIGLDLIALDYFGLTLRRRVSEGDAAFSTRIRGSLLRPQGTRAAVIANLTALTGRAPVVFEPRNTTDTGGWWDASIGAGTGFAWDTTGGWGDLNLPFQAFITAYRPTGGGVSGVMGFYYGTSSAIGGWDTGAIEWVSDDMVVGAVTDQDILDTINASRPVATILWTQISA